MGNGATIHARIDAQTKHEAQGVLNDLGLTMSEAISLYFRQVVLHKGIPFEISIPNDLTASTLRESKEGKNLNEVSGTKGLMGAISA